MKAERVLIPLGAVVLLAVIFGVPAVLVPVTMDNVAERSRIKILTSHGDAVDLVRETFRRHGNPASQPGRLEPLPDNSTEWIEFINPMRRRAPGGGPAFLPEANDETGAIGVEGDTSSVTVTLPAYAGLTREETVVTSGSESSHR